MGVRDRALACPFCGSTKATACELQTVPTSFAVVCNECGATGPRGETYADANEEWADRGVIETVAELDEALAALALHARMVRDGLAASDPDVERAVALGGLCVVVVALEQLAGNAP